MIDARRSTIRIGSADATLDDVAPQWIHQQLHRRRADDLSVCVQARIIAVGVDVLLTTPECGGGSGTRVPHARERRVIDLWQKLHLHEPSAPAGNLIAFVQQVSSAVR